MRPLTVVLREFVILLAVFAAVGIVVWNMPERTGVSGPPAAHPVSVDRLSATP
jgi:hypothetical protein